MRKEEYEGSVSGRGLRTFHLFGLSLAWGGAARNVIIGSSVGCKEMQGEVLIGG